MLLHYRNLDHLMDVRGHQVGVSSVDVSCEAGQGVQSLATQPAGEALRVDQDSVGLQAANILESSLTNLGGLSGDWRVAQHHLPRTAEERRLGCGCWCCCCSTGGRWSRWTEGLTSVCPGCPLFYQLEKHRDSPPQHQCPRSPPPRKSSCY